MTRDVLIVYFGTDWEGENRTSAHHLARSLASRHRMLYFECPGLRAPSVTGRDLRRMLQKVKLAFAAPRRPNERTEVRTLLQLPLRRFRPIARLNEMLIRWRVRSLVRQARGTSAVTSWFLVPHVGHLADSIGEDRSIYYCVDDHSAMPGMDVDVVRRMDDELTGRVDLVFAVSKVLFERKASLARRVMLAPHGVDVAHFRRAAAGLPRPADLPPGSPIIGYFGLVADWIDLELIQLLAERRPEWQFVMIGRIATSEARLPTASNVHLLGRRPYEQLPEYGAHFDVALIPYLPNEQVRNANPLKLREYLAMEKPIVSVSTPEIDGFSDYISIAGTVDEWEKAIELELTGQHGIDSRARRTLVDGMSWERRLAEVESVALAGLDA